MGASGWLAVRAVMLDTDTGELMVQDADLAIKALLGLFRREPFTFGWTVEAVVVHHHVGVSECHQMAGR